jgi:hypothetical protein
MAKERWFVARQGNRFLRVEPTVAAVGQNETTPAFFGLTAALNSAVVTSMTV